MGVGEGVEGGGGWEEVVEGRGGVEKVVREGGGGMVGGVGLLEG